MRNQLLRKPCFVVGGEDNVISAAAGHECRIFTSIWIGFIHLLLKWSVKSKGEIYNE